MRGSDLASRPPHQAPPRLQADARSEAAVGGRRARVPGRTARPHAHAGLQPPEPHRRDARRRSRRDERGLRVVAEDEAGRPAVAARGRLRDEAASREDALPVAGGSARRRSTVSGRARRRRVRRGRRSPGRPLSEIRRAEHGGRPEDRARPRGDGAAQGARCPRAQRRGRRSCHHHRGCEGNASAFERAVAVGSGVAEAVEGDGRHRARRDRRARRRVRGRHARGRAAHVVHVAGRASIHQRARRYWAARTPRVRLARDPVAATVR